MGPARGEQTPRTTGSRARRPPRGGAAPRVPRKPLFATRHRGLAQELARLVPVLATDTTVLLLGAPGTGKDRLARLLHERSPRAARPFVRVDLGALTEDLFESELFGHEKGAFTGAIASKPGLLESAAGGTLYLDRIDVVPPAAQGKLLRVLEERIVCRVGGTRATTLSARFVASAGSDLPRLVREGSFREDLYWRIAVVTVRLPTLDERRCDLLPAARAQLRALGGTRFTKAAERALLAHPWRGNFRELENAVRRAEVEARRRGAADVDAADLALATADDAESFLAAAARSGWPLRRVSDAYIDLVLSECGGNVSDAARRLGVARRTLYDRKRRG